MSHLPFVISAYFLNAIAVTIDKFLITKSIPNPLVYIFYISLFSLVSLLLLPFTHLPSLTVFLLASASTILWTTGIFFSYKGLQIGPSSRVIPIIGTLVPLILLFQAGFTGTISLSQIWAVLILILALVIITLPGWRGGIKPQEFLFELLSALFLAFSYVALRESYLQENFLTVLVYSRMILLPLILLVLLIPISRKIVVSSHGPKINFLSKVGLLFLVGQMIGGTQELLLTFSISLSDPALVSSLQGTQYIFLFIFSLALSRKYPQVFKESLSLLNILGKIVGITLIGVGLYILAMSQNIYKPTLGVTFSPRYAQELGLNPQQTYKKMLTDLKVKNIRLPLYWDEVEKEQGKYNFTDTANYIKEAQKEGAEVILVVGYKQPRWPECFAPSWTQNLTSEQKSEQIVNLVREEVNYFKQFNNIKAWQVENEPFLNFGKCEKVTAATKQRLQQEVALVKSLDNRPILLTDSGELSNWVKALSLSPNIFGTTLYRNVWNPIFGSVSYPLPPFFYQAKAWLVKTFTASQTKQFIVSELQAEPWAPAKVNVVDVTLEQQVKLFPPEQIKKNIDFAAQTNFSQIYLWGVEWWYFMDAHNHPEYLEQAKLDLL